MTKTKTTTKQKQKKKKTKEAFQSLAGQLLIAMPGIGDERFEKAVIYVHTHTKEDGAMGLVINQPNDTISFGEILDQLNITSFTLNNPPRILSGGPVQVSRGFILHSKEYDNKIKTGISGDVALAATQDIIRDLAKGKGPRHSLIALGCATWIQGQLEEEIMDNIWLTAQSNDAILFKEPYEKRWDTAIKSIGIDPRFLATDSGKA
ncbi:MAG: YqgE/AlgH family protein [Lactobacillales bacterium]|jgi:putative transcriptional regulator|nr:YqgE/AlgH family protein [Lactobacillales bacterium]